MIKFWWEFWWRTIWICCRWSWISKPWVPEFRHHLVSRCDSRAIHIWFIKCLHHVLFCMKMIFWCYCSNYMYCWLNTTAIVCLAMFRIFCLILVCAAKRWQSSTEWPHQAKRRWECYSARNSQGNFDFGLLKCYIGQAYLLVLSDRDIFV